MELNIKRLLDNEIKINKFTILNINLNDDVETLFKKTKFKDNSFSVKQFIELKEISYKSKIRTITQLFSHEQNVKFATLCARSVLHFFEQKYSNDKRSRQAIEAAEKWLINPSQENKNAAAADAAAAANAAYAAYAADAANAAYAAANAAYAANAAAADAAANAAYAAYAADAAYAESKIYNQEEINLKFLIQISEE